MPISALKVPKYVSPKESIISWNTWRKGLNTLLRENELDAAEMATATNLLLVGSGVPTKRWGSQDYFKSGATGTTNSVFYVKDSSDNIQNLAFTDWGLLTKKSGTSYTNITGASWPSGSRLEAAQLGGNAYIVSEEREFVRYNFTNLVGFATLAIPASVLVTNMSGASGSTTWSWRVTAVGKSGGETIASTPVSMASLPQILTQTVMRINWTAVSAASGDLSGYNIYRGSSGNETWVGGVNSDTTRFDDTGAIPNDPFRTAPVADATGGPKAKYIMRFQDRLILAGIPGDPTKVLISGRYPYQERFDWYAGGGYVYIEPDSGQNVTGLGIHQEKLVIFKENSVWQVNLNQITFGNYIILDPQYKLLTASQGCSSFRSIVPVENDVMFANRKGIYILRYEPQLLTIINASEISAKIRPFFESLSDTDLTTCAGVYYDKKYLLSFPSSKQIIMFDRERLSFMGPWTLPYGITHWSKFVDSAGTERLIGADSNDNQVTEFSKTLTSDKGTAIKTIFKTRKEDFGDWTLGKTINALYMNFKSITGTISINIYIEDRSGNLITAKSFTVTGSGSSGTSGFGTDGMGLVPIGLSNNSVQISVAETSKKIFVYKPSRLFQVEIRTAGSTDNYELLGILAAAIKTSRGNAPSSWNI
ncbi:hypothetical protein M0R04_15070 [Candidatus Dojkabacteria bacterium]|jgi:hypothetical protein|nr:hypothetical protein [Candidatus Dojkabacteria bacterium]